MKPDMGFKQGEDVRIEVTNGYEWEAEVTEYKREKVPNARNGGKDYIEHALLLDMPRHPARRKPNKMGQGYLCLESGELTSPNNGKKFTVERVWRPTDL